MKQCHRCDQILPLMGFYKNLSSPDGFYKICKQCKSTSVKKYVIANKNKVAKSNAIWFQNNKEIVRNKRSSYIANRLATNLGAKLAHSLRRRLNTAIKNNQKSGSAVTDLGCSIIELKKHLKNQFQPEMTWDNWGKGRDKWHIDHIRPLSSFNLSDSEQFKEASGYKNLQPLWELDNLSKGAKYEQS